MGLYNVTSPHLTVVMGDCQDTFFSQGSTQPMLCGLGLTSCFSEMFYHAKYMYVLHFVGGGEGGMPYPSRWYCQQTYYPYVEQFHGFVESQRRMILSYSGMAHRQSYGYRNQIWSHFAGVSVVLETSKCTGTYNAEQSKLGHHYLRKKKAYQRSEMTIIFHVSNCSQNWQKNSSPVKKVV